MPQMVGIAIRTKNHGDGPPHLWQNTVGEGMRRHVHLCFFCQHFCYKDPVRNCPESQRFYELAKASYISLAITRCPNFCEIAKGGSGGN